MFSRTSAPMSSSWAATRRRDWSALTLLRRSVRETSGRRNVDTRSLTTSSSETPVPSRLSTTSLMKDALAFASTMACFLAVARTVSDRIDSRYESTVPWCTCITCLYISSCLARRLSSSVRLPFSSASRMLRCRSASMTMAKILRSSLNRTSSLLRYSSVWPTSRPTALLMWPEMSACWCSCVASLSRSSALSSSVSAVRSSLISS
mmetsp:Transcript_13538/g.33160  ORF Transcript_13538/g.33160 Transcript_13538/m.33160 type:complete len:206 (-) Transcript_13538:1281-1898(-)